MASPGENRWDKNIDRANFSATILAIVIVSVPLLFAPEECGNFLQRIYDAVAFHFGVLYAFCGCAALLLLLWLAFGRYGRVKLGDETDQPEFSTFSWTGMLFCAGVGAGLMYWSSIEWAYYYQSPPFGAEPKSVEAANWALSYGVFHWGIIAWSFYCVPTLAIAYPFYVKKVPSLKFSLSCHYFLKGKEEGAIARLMDFLFMLALIGGAGTSLGFSTPLIASLVSHLTGIDNCFGVQATVVAVCIAIFTVSVYLGLEKGIRRLSEINAYSALGLAVYVLLAGPTLFLIKAALTSFGTVAQNFIQMSTWTDPYSNSGFFEDWTVFYWAWWVAFGPFVGLFVTRISRGRTIREVVLGMLIYGSLGSALFYWTLGGFCLHQELSGQVRVLDILNEHDGNQAIIACFDHLPLAKFFMIVFCLVSVIFSATTYDSAAYALASNATHRLAPSEDPPRWHRCFWSFAIGILPLALMYVGGLKVVQSAVLVTSLPIVFVGILMSFALVKSLRQDHGS